MRIPILSGIYADPQSDWKTSYPHNLEPIPKVTGVSEGHLRSAEGIKSFATGPGNDRGGINWRGVCYRVMGSRLVSVSESGVIVDLDDVGPGGQASFSYGFTYLAICSGGRLFLFDGTTLTENTDSDLGAARNVQWIDGYFFTTDGEHLVVTELTDPFSVLPFNYGSSEVDPDDVMSVVRLNSEIYAINRHTIEGFTNVGGQFFPFRVIDGTQIYRGAVGTHAAAVFMKGIAFVGSGREEEPGVYLYAGGAEVKISTRDIDGELAALSEDALADIVCEARVYGGREVLYIHLATKTWVYDGTSTAALQQPVWFSLDSNGPYRARNFVWCYGKWIVGDPNSPALGCMTDQVADHHGAVVNWEFGSPVVFNEDAGVVVHQLDLTCLTGGAQAGKTSTVSMRQSEDGVTWTPPRYCDLGTRGQTARPVQFKRLGRMQARRMFRFKGDSNARISISHIKANVEALAW